jgi:hypothetical protein
VHPVSGRASDLRHRLVVPPRVTRRLQQAPETLSHIDGRSGLPCHSRLCAPSSGLTVSGPSHLFLPLLRPGFAGLALGLACPPAAGREVVTERGSHGRQHAHEASPASRVVHGPPISNGWQPSMAASYGRTHEVDWSDDATSSPYATRTHRRRTPRLALPTPTRFAWDVVSDAAIEAGYTVTEERQYRSRSVIDYGLITRRGCPG